MDDPATNIREGDGHETTDRGGTLLLAADISAGGAAGPGGGYVCFVAVGESVLPMSDQTMPFWRDGYLYIASSTFTGAAGEALNIGGCPAAIR